MSITFSISWGNVHSREDEEVNGDVVKAKIMFNKKVEEANHGLLSNFQPVDYVYLNSSNGLGMEWRSNTMLTCRDLS
jgi:hypothetical protein